MRDEVRARRSMYWLLFVYTGASLLHFIHNAEYLQAYPNLPEWLTRGGVYLSWVAVASVGLLGLLLYRLQYRFAGLSILGLYAALGFDGLLHYTRAPMHAHTAPMNFTIWFEVIAAALLLLSVLHALRKETLAISR